MGGIAQAVIRAFMLIAPGYFANDLVEGAGKVFGIKTNEENKYPVWFPIAVILAIAVAVVVFFNPFKSKSRR